MVLIKPRKATHALLDTADGKKAFVAVDDLDTLHGTAGTLTWFRMHQKEREILGKIKFDGNIEEITNDYRTRPRK
jgi:hypothetical protein